MTRFALFCQSVISDWNHGNAHFLRGLARALQARGHQVVCYEQVDNWSISHLLQHAPDAIEAFRSSFPDLHVERYQLNHDLETWLRQTLSQIDVAVVHEWNAPQVIRNVARFSKQLGIKAFFHDTHYRVVLDSAYREQLALEHFDGILAFSPSIAQRYRELGFSNVHVLHEAADTSVYHPLPLPKTADVVFVGNYGDTDRSDELEDYVFGPRADLPHLAYAIYGVRYPEHVLTRFRNGLDVRYRGWLPNVRVPHIYSAARVVLHVPRRQYVELLPGTPTIRVFEALASGACLISLPWPDTDHLFEAGQDYLVARSPAEMRGMIDWLCRDDSARERIGRHGRRTILDRHTCGHRAEQLLTVVSQ
jgi:spore maturation protein CgeB